MGEIYLTRIKMAKILGIKSSWFTLCVQNGRLPAPTHSKPGTGLKSKFYFENEAEEIRKIYNRDIKKYNPRKIIGSSVLAGTETV